MAKQIKNVALAGATGTVGSRVLKALLNDKFTVTALTRNSGATFPDGVIAKVVDFKSRDGLAAALRGQDAVIDTTASSDTESPTNLIEAAVSVGVHRFISAEFGADPENSKVTALPVFSRKAVLANLLKAKAREGSITWTGVATGVFLDYGLWTGFLCIGLKHKTIKWIGDGDNVSAATTLDDVAKATSAVLLHPEETENRVVYVSSVVKSQRGLAAAAKEALGPDGWQEETMDIEKEFQQAMADFQSGKYEPQVFSTMIRYALSNPEYCRPWKKDDNELLGLKPMSDAELRDLIKELPQN